MTNTAPILCLNYQTIKCLEPLCIKCTYPFFFSQFDNTRYETGIPSLCMDCSYAESIEHLHHFLVNHKPFYIFLSELQLAQICYNYTISSLTIYDNEIPQQLEYKRETVKS